MIISHFIILEIKIYLILILFIPFLLLNTYWHSIWWKISFVLGYRLIHKKTKLINLIENGFLVSLQWIAFLIKDVLWTEVPSIMQYFKKNNLQLNTVCLLLFFKQRIDFKCGVILLYFLHFRINWLAR